MARFSLLVWASALVAGTCCWAAPADELAPPTLRQAHAHNDYYHKRPLLDALDHGFASVEADVFLVGDQLLVGHYKFELRPERSLAALYLDPLQARVAAQGGAALADGRPLTLLIDFKTDGAAAYKALAQLLARYGDMFSRREGDAVVAGPVRAIVTGNRPIDEIAADANRRVAIDGRLNDLSRNAPVDLIPLVSESWSDHFKWRGQGDMPESERRRLRELVAQVHQQGRQLRFWGAPDNAASWREQLDAGVDVVGADDLDALRKFLMERGDK
jgi:hypothetical protein